jgi:hypothetical protein
MLLLLLCLVMKWHVQALSCYWWHQQSSFLEQKEQQQRQQQSWAHLQ